MKFGKAKYSGDFVQRKYFKLKDGEQAFRILPPMGDLADDGIWSKYYSVHYGYKNSKDKMRVFQSCEVKNKKSKMVEVPDAALERIQKGKAAYEAAKAAGNKDQMEKLDKLFAGQKAQFNLDKNHYLNVIDTQGNIGVLKLRHRAKLALDELIKRLREQGVDPLDPVAGRFLIFRRSGKGVDTSFTVEVMKEKIQIDGVGLVEREIVHKLTDDIVSRLANEAADLSKLFKAPTSEEIARIVNEGAKAVDEILDAKSDGGSNDSGDEGDYEDEEESTPSSSGQAAAPQQTAAPAPQVAAPAPVQTAPSAPVQTAPVVSTPVAPPAAPQTTAAALAQQSDDEFLKSLGL